MLSWVAWIFVLGIVIFVHELGHFLAAKWAGVYAPRFSLGWGSPLWSFRRGETEYALSWLPIGGYVRMASKEDETAAILEGGAETPEAEKSKHWDEESMIPHGPKPIPADRWFESKPLYKRLVIMLAGVFMNVVLAIFVSTGLVYTAGAPHAVPVADSILPGRPAAAAGMLRGDSVTAIDGTAITRWEEVQATVSAAAGRALTFSIVRAGSPIELVITPELQEVRTATGERQQVGRIGVAPGTAAGRRDPVTIPQAARGGWNLTWEMAGVVVGILRNLFSGEVSIKEMGGPIEIARQSVLAAQEGAVALWSLIALLSINLAVINLLPIPLLDGGQILLQVAESAWRRPFPARVKEWYAMFGLVTILLLFITVTFNDLRRIVSGLLGG